LDNGEVGHLTKKINKALCPCDIPNCLICIPVQELEAWLLSDPDAIRAALNLPVSPNIKHPPETINSPKEHLGNLISRASKREKIYMNTVHNEKIAKHVSIDRLRAKCPSFLPFDRFIQQHLAN